MMQLWCWWCKDEQIIRAILKQAEMCALVGGCSCVVMQPFVCVCVSAAGRVSFIFGLPVQAVIQPRSQNRSCDSGGRQALLDRHLVILMTGKSPISNENST